VIELVKTSAPESQKVLPE